MSKIDDKLNEVLGIAEETNELEVIQNEKKELTISVPEDKDPDIDFETGRKNLYNLLDKGNEAIDGILNLAKEGEHPRAYEVAGQLIKTVSEVSQNLLDIQEKLKKFKDIIYQQTAIINHFKKHFNRRRPVEVLSSLNTLPSETNKTRSYPSGHACQSVVVARYVAGKVPKLEKELMKAAYECGYGRVVAGFHYVSDYEAGNLLGEKLYVLMNKMDYGQEVNEDKVSFKDFLKN